MAVVEVIVEGYGQVVPIVVELVFPIQIGHSHQVEVPALLTVRKSVVQPLREVVPLVGGGERVFCGGESHSQAEEGEVVHRVNLITEVKGQGAGVAVGIVFGGGVAGGCGVEALRAILTEYRTGLLRLVGRRAAHAKVDVGRELFVLQHIAHPRAIRGAVAATEAEREEMAVAYLGAGDDVDDVAALLHHIFGRGVLDDLDAVDGIGMQRLEIDFQRIAVHVGGIAVNPYLDVGGAAHGDVAFDVHLHTGGVLQGIEGVKAFDGLVVRHVVVHHLVVHTVDGARCADRNGLEGFDPLEEQQAILLRRTAGGNRFGAVGLSGVSLGCLLGHSGPDGIHQFRGNLRHPLGDRA